jgi:hypothetical protein
MKSIFPALATIAIVSAAALATDAQKTERQLEQPITAATSPGMDSMGT